MRIGYNYASMQRKIANYLLIFSLLFAAFAIPQKTVEADSGISSAGDLITLVNNIRTSAYGLPALVENATLDSCALWTAQEMASTNATTHLAYLGYSSAATRCAGYGFGGGKTIHVTENMAYSALPLTYSGLQDWWSDADHLLPMDDPQYVYVGAGVATASNGRVYYVLQAGAVDGVTAAEAAASSSVSTTSSTTVSGTTAEATTDTSQQETPIVTSTPNYDGNIYHTVQYGQTLFNIALAYNITLSYLKSENGLTSDDIQSGKTLLIKAAPTATVTPTATITPVYPTRTPTLTPQPRTPTPAPTATATPKPTLIESLSQVDRPSLGIILVVLSALGLAAVMFFSFIRPKKD